MPLIQWIMITEFVILSSPSPKKKKRLPVYDKKYFSIASESLRAGFHGNKYLVNGLTKCTANSKAIYIYNLAKHLIPLHHCAFEPFILKASQVHHLLHQWFHRNTSSKMMASCISSTIPDCIDYPSVVAKPGKIIATFLGYWFFLDC